MRHSIRFLRSIKKHFEIWWRWPLVKIPVIFFFLIFCIVVIIPFASSRLFALPVFSPLKSVETPQTQVISNTLALYSLGTWSVIYGPVEQWMVVNETSVALLIRGPHIPGLGNNKLVVFDQETGDLFWQDISSIVSLATDRKRVYVGGVYQIQAYDLRTGERVWKYTKPVATHGGLYVFVEGDNLKAYNYEVSYGAIMDVVVLDAQTGEYLNTETLSEPRHPRQYTYTVAETGGLKYNIHSDKTVIAEDKQTGETIGALEVTVPIDKILASDKILAIYSEPSREITVFAVGEKGQ